MMKQLKFTSIYKSDPFSHPFRRKVEHGGSVTLGRRRRKRPMILKQPLHLVLRSDFAYGNRALTRHRPLIVRVLKKAQKRFNIRIYKVAVVSNHIHLAVKGDRRINLQNFFRVVAGRIAQEILRSYPILKGEKPRISQKYSAPSKSGGAPENAPKTTEKTREKENKFWKTRVYTRIVSWGIDFKNVINYVIRNHLEALGLIPYKERNGSQKKQIFALKTRIAVYKNTS